MTRRKACLPCTKAKRKCGKESPACSRCVRKCGSCVYPPQPSARSISTGVATNGGFPTLSDQRPSIDVDFAAVLAQTMGLPEELAVPNNPWFLEVESWTLEHIANTPDPTLEKEVDRMYRYLDELQNWSRKWVSDGSNPFIHSQLHKSALPECIQDAYTALAGYVGATKKNSRMSLRIVESRAQKLVQEEQLGEFPDFLTLDTYSHLARTQALFTYLLILLFDGDIRARSQAETHTATLERWLSEMWESASLDIKAAPSNRTSNNPMMDPDMFWGGGENIFLLDGSLHSIWKAWIVAESVKRTYLAAKIMLSTYFSLKNGWCGCPGGLTYSARRGLWEAGSPHAWLEAIKGKDMLPLPSLHCGRLLREAKPVDVDEFTTTVLMISHGIEKTEEWLAGSKLGDLSYGAVHTDK